MEHSEKNEENSSANSTNSSPSEEEMDFFILRLQNWIRTRLLHRHLMGREFNTLVFGLRGENERDRQATAQHIINNLPNETIQEEVKCPICQHNCPSGEVLKKLPCNHLYHEDCILTWLKTNNNCPICRQEMEIDEGDLGNVEKTKE